MRTSRLTWIVVTALIAGGLLLASPRRSSLAPGTQADRLVVEKSQRRLELYSRGRPIRSYAVALGRKPVGAKERAGDDRTPEGTYVIDGRNASSEFHRSLHVSYPSPADAARARRGHYSAGGDIMIHGLKNGLGWLGGLHRSRDWTRGCIAVTNAEIEEIWQVVPDGTPIEIRP